MILIEIGRSKHEILLMINSNRVILSQHHRLFLSGQTQTMMTLVTKGSKEPDYFRLVFTNL